MASYRYSEGGRKRGMERGLWVVMSIMVTFVLLSTFNPAVKEYLKHHQGTFGVVLVVMYLMFLMFSRRMFRQQKLAQIRLSTTRKGFTFTDGGGEQIQSWRDLKEATARVDVDNQGQAYVRRIVFRWAKGKARLDNDIGFELREDASTQAEGSEARGAADLLAEVSARTEGLLKYHFHWYHAVCPFCKADLPHRGKACESCGRAVVFVSKFRRPWEMVREENLYIFLLALMIGTSFPIFYLVALTFVVTVLTMTLLMNTPGRLRLLETGVRAAVMALLGGALWLGSTVSARCSPWPFSTPSTPAPSAVPAAPSAVRASVVPAPPSAVPATVPRAANPLADAAYFPLARGNTWEYRSNFDTVVMKVTGTELVNGVHCFVMESFVGDTPQSVQSEDYGLNHDGLQVYKRASKGSEFFLQTPETMLAFPLRDGKHWTWQGDALQGSVMLTFKVVGARHVSVLGQDRVALCILIHGRAADGTEIQTKRWYCRNVGMVREQTIMKKNGRATKMEATLRNYSLHLGRPDGE